MLSSSEAEDEGARGLKESGIELYSPRKRIRRTSQQRREKAEELFHKEAQKRQAAGERQEAREAAVLH